MHSETLDCWWQNEIQLSWSSGEVAHTAVTVDEEKTSFRIWKLHRRTSNCGPQGSDKWETWITGYSYNKEFVNQAFSEYFSCISKVELLQNTFTKRFQKLLIATQNALKLQYLTWLRHSYFNTSSWSKNLTFIPVIWRKWQSLHAQD